MEEKEIVAQDCLPLEPRSGALAVAMVPLLQQRCPCYGGGGDSALAVVGLWWETIPFSSMSRFNLDFMKSKPKFLSPQFHLNHGRDNLWSQTLKEFGLDIIKNI